MRNLRKHYQKVKQGLKDQLEDIAEIEDLVKADTAEEQWKDHKALVEKTERNIQKEKERLEGTKKRKLDLLQQKVSEGNKGGASRPKGKRGRGRGSPKRPTSGVTPPPPSPRVTCHIPSRGRQTDRTAWCPEGPWKSTALIAVVSTGARGHSPGGALRLPQGEAPPRETDYVPN